MKIRIKADRHNIHLWLPTSLLKSRICYHILQNGVRKNAKNAEISTREQEENVPKLPTQQKTVCISRKQQLDMYKALRQVIKTRGHFNIVEVESADGQKVLIRV
ncbi:MAG: hypothetical protein J1F66_00860 [Clostridiales bacterium]|nr:hypothetical protein [Clostridiales bacterium]